MQTAVAAPDAATMAVLYASALTATPADDAVTSTPERRTATAAPAVNANIPPNNVASARGQTLPSSLVASIVRAGPAHATDHREDAADRKHER